MAGTGALPVGIRSDRRLHPGLITPMHVEERTVS